MSTSKGFSGVIDVQVVPSGASGLQGALGNLPQGAEEVVRRGVADVLYDAVSFDDIERAIEQVCGAVTSAMDKVRPESCSIEFSMGFKAGAKVPVLVNGEASATFKITLNWKKSPV